LKGIFWINLPFVGIGALLVIVFLNLRFKPTSLLSKLQRVDWIGIVLFTASLTGFLIPVTWGGVLYPWSSWRTLVPLLVCAAGLAVFWVWEELGAKEPLIRPSVLKNRTAAVTFFGTFVHGMLLWLILYYEPLYYQVSDLDSQSRKNSADTV
jgi:Fungal trichothecene efflux pump (TRI12)